MPASTSSKASGGAKPKPRGPPAPVQYYLIAYNLASFFGWMLILSTAIKHLLAGPQTSSIPLQFSAKVLERFRPLRTLALYQYNYLPPPLDTFAYRSAVLQQFSGALVAFVQSFAILEVVHAAIGWVRSPVATTAIQVASRLFLVWGVSERYSDASTSPFYGSMILAWSITEVIRYPFYASQLMSNASSGLLWLRYTTFYILYPVGAISEALLIYATLPKTLPWDNATTWVHAPKTWGPRELVYGGLFIIWWPGLYVMYTHMIKQRRRAIGKGFFGDQVQQEVVDKKKAQ